MKKIICILLTLIIFSTFSFVAFAGDVPYALAENDDAVIYFGQVKKAYYSEKQALVKPIRVIKGDVPIDGTLVLENIGISPVITGNTYIFTRFSDTGESYILYPDSFDTATLKVADRSAFSDEIEAKINSGRYKETDNQRIDRINEALITGTGIRLTETFGMKKETSQTIKADNKKLSYEKFYLLCDEITAYPVDISENINKALIASSIKLENGNTIDITSDGKIQISYPSSRRIYVVSTEDRDKLLSLLPEENLPSIHFGTIRLILLTVTGIALSAAGFIIIKKKKNR